MSGQHSDDLHPLAVAALAVFLVFAVAVMAAGVWFGFMSLLSWMLSA